MKMASIQQPLSPEALPSPLSSRAKPRDLQFRGPFLGMFFDRVVMGLPKVMKNSASVA
jgi:hypothetical protein